MTDFTIIRRSMSARLFSTVTTVLTVAVAVGLMLTLLSMRNAGRQAFERGSGNMHLLLSGDESPMVAVLNGVFYANAPSRAISWEVYERLIADPRIDWAIPTQQGDSYEGYPVLATTPAFFTKFQPEDGRTWVFSDGRALENDFEVVLGSQAAAGTGVKVGDKIHLTHGTAGAREAHIHEEFAFTVVGTLAATGGPHDRAVFTTLDSAWIVHAVEAREREAGHDHDHADEHGADAHDHDHGHIDAADIELTDEERRITGVYIRIATRPGASVSASLGPVAAGLRAQSGFTIASPSSEMGRLFKIVSNVDVIFRVLAAVVLLSSAIGIMLALYNSMEQRRRQVAVLRVLGASRARIFGLLLTEAAVIGLLGAAAGVLLGLVGGWLCAGLLRERVGLVVTPVYGVEWVLPVVAGAVLLGAAAGLVPAVMAYRTAVAKNLRPVG